MFLAFIAHATFALSTNSQSPIGAAPTVQIEGSSGDFRACHTYDGTATCDADDPSNNQPAGGAVPFYGKNLVTVRQFIRLAGPPSLPNERFYIGYSTKKGQNCATNPCSSCAACGTRKNNVMMSVFELACSEEADVLIFGTGYGCRRQGGPTCCEGAQYTPAQDASSIDSLIRGCLKITGAVTLDFVAPHAHGDHINPETVHALQNTHGYVINKIYVHVDDLAGLTSLQPGFTNCGNSTWTSNEINNKFVTFGTSGGLTPCNNTPACEQNWNASGVKSFNTTVGRVWFQERDGHTAGSVDLVLDINGVETNRFVLYGSVPPGETSGNNCHNPASTCTLSGVVWTADAHGNVYPPPP